ncbi:microtubule associated protein-domain-containing protein [Chlamydoabsidia padenii]|nr:microtubule associated protein-domain-containing protein [Chlamydoabsidia padenii]
MEHLQLKVSRLETLWSCLGTCADSITIGDKLKHVMLELDKVLEYEEWRKQVLVANIEDIMASIECGCQILGISLDSLLTSNIMNESMIGIDGYQDWEFYATLCVMTPTMERQKALTILNNRLANEIRQRKAHVKEWLSTIKSLCHDLDLTPPVDLHKNYDDDLCWGTVQKISCTMRDLAQKQTTNKFRFEQLVHTIHYYWSILDEPINVDDPIDIALHNLCDTVTITPDHAFDMNQPPPSIIDQQHTTTDPVFLYYRHPLPYPLSLRNDLMTVLQAKAHDLSTLYNIRLADFNHYVNSIQTLWEELNVPAEKRCTIYHSLHGDNLIKLQTNFDAMKTIVQTMTDEYIDTIRKELEQLWDDCLLTQDERDEFLAALYREANTMDAVRAIMDKHMEYLKYIRTASQDVAKIMKERKELIQKMINFETAASDPKRLFQASFQLLEEERWRKTCFPTLLQLDDLLIKAVQELEWISEKHFLVGNRRYLDILRDEIADRTANQTFFGFLNTEPNHDRPVRSKSRPNSLYASTHSVSITTNTTKKSKTSTVPLSESPTQDMPPFNDIQPQNRRNSSGALKRRSSPTNNNTSILNTTDSPQPIPSTSTARRMQPSLSTRPKKLFDAKKRLSSQSIPIQQQQQQTPIIPQQYKSKSYPVSRTKSTLIKNKKSINNISVKTNLDQDNRRSPSGRQAEDDQQRLEPSSPPTTSPPPPPPRSKASQIPVRAQPSTHRPSSTSPTSRQQEQQQLTVQCA